MGVHSIRRGMAVAREKPARFTEQNLNVARLDQDLIGPRHTCAIGILPVAMAGDGEHGDCPRADVGAQPPAQLDAVEAGTSMSVTMRSGDDSNALANAWWPLCACSISKPSRASAFE